jgi:hypothetical protein
MEFALAVIALVGAVVVAVTLLNRQRARTRPEDAEPKQAPVPNRTRRQQRILEKLSPLPEIPTLMDLVHEEIAAAKIDEVPGSEGLPAPVMLKAYKRDEIVRERCPHGTYEFVVADGVVPAEATEADVRLFCKECGDTEAETNPPE